MSINYNLLWKKLIDLKITKTQLRQSARFSTSALSKMNKGEPVSLAIIERICKTLDCKVEDILEITQDK